MLPVLNRSVLYFYGFFSNLIHMSVWCYVYFCNREWLKFEGLRLPTIEVYFGAFLFWGLRPSFFAFGHMESSQDDHMLSLTDGMSSDPK